MNLESEIRRAIEHYGLDARIGCFGGVTWLHGFEYVQVCGGALYLCVEHYLKEKEINFIVRDIHSHSPIGNWKENYDVMEDCVGIVFDAIEKYKNKGYELPVIEDEKVQEVIDSVELQNEEVSV